MPISWQNRLYRVLLILIWSFLPQISRGEAYPGFTLISPNNSRTTQLVNMSNSVVHTWTHTRSGGYSAYLLENGLLLRSANISNTTFNGGGSTGAAQEVNWNGDLVWEYIYSNTSHQAHHDLEKLPNGNVLMIAWEMKTATQARQAGYNRNVSIWPDHLIEVQPSGANGGTIVWEWHAWDHLIQHYDASRDNYGVIADHPELLDINMGAGGMGPQGGDWMHINAVSYNPELDQIVISSHTLNELYVIDHSTTTAEAATHSGGVRGHGGDILYRWGMPANYGAPGAQVFDVVHCSVWIPSGLPGEGHLMAFNNRDGQGTSMVVEIIPPMDESGNYILVPGAAYGPAAPTWSYTTAGFYSNHLGGCQRLPNGNTMIAEATSGYLFEVNSSGVTQWSFQRGGEIPRVLRYSLCYSGLSAISLCPPVGLTAASVDGNIILRWQEVSGAQEYHVYRLQHPDDSIVNGTLVATTTGTTTTILNEVAAYETAYYTVTAIQP